MTLDAIPFDLRSMLEGIADGVAAKASAKGLDVVLHYPMHLPRSVVGDPNRFRQIVLNLVSNAVKFTEAGHVLVKLSYDSSSGRFEILVEDTGVGIDEANVESLFRPFVQADASSTRRFGGTGLGLAIARELAALMGGSVQYRPTSKSGATFVFDVGLPVREDVSPELLPSVDFKKVRVLIVDDNELNCQVLHEQISAWKMRNGRFASGHEALRALRDAQEAGDPYQIAIVDYQMPGLDGYKLGKLIKADPALHDTALIMLTSMARPGDATVLAEARFDGYLVKPVHQSRLLDVLQTVWSARVGRRDVGLTTVHSLGAGRRRLTFDEENLKKRAARILLVEDNDVNQLLATEFLELFGCTTICAVNGVEGIAAMRRETFDLVFMDIQMPVLGGLEAIEIIRGDAALADATVIAMTAHALEGDCEKFLAAGMTDYIAKPLSRERLAAILVKWLLA